MRLLLFTVACFVSCASCCAQLDSAAGQEQPVISIPYIISAPAVDGELDDAVWKTAARAPFVTTLGQPRGYFMMCYDLHALYIAFWHDEPHMATLIATQKARDGEIWNQDNFQVFLSPRHGHRNYFQFMVSAINTQWDARIEDYFSNIDLSYNAKWTSAVKRREDGWHAEIAIPFEAFGAKPVEGDTWGLNVCYTRANSMMPVHSGASWSGLIAEANFHLADCFGFLRFAGNEPVVRVESIPQTAGRAQELRLEVLDKDDFAIDYRIGPRGCWREFHTKKVKGNATTTCSISPAAGDRELSAAVKDDKGHVIYSTGRVMLTPQSPPRNAKELFRWLQTNGPSVGKGDHAYGVGVISSMTKVLPQQAERIDEFPQREIRLQAARNETEAAQILLYAPHAGLKDVQLELSDLKSDDAVIPSSNLWAAPVGFVNVKPQNNYPVDFAGWTSDPILTYLEKFDVRAGDVQPVWVAVNVPSDTKPGIYKGKIAIKPANAPAASVEIQLKVWGFELPALPSLPTAIGQIQGARYVYAHEKASAKRIADLDAAIDKFHVSRRIAPGDIYRPWPITVREIERWKNLPINQFNIVYIGERQLQKGSEEFKPGLDKQIAEAMKAVKEAGLQNRAYFYGFDELAKPHHAKAQRVFARLKKQYTGTKILSTILDNTFDMDNALTAIEAFCPLVSHYDYHRARQARRRGKEVWWYVCCGPARPYPNFLLENPLIETRMLLGFMSFTFGVDGFLYYRMSSSENNHKLLSGGPYVDWDTFSYKTYNGDGHIWYPGKDGPITSIRMENWRDGLEDYEYLILARDEIQRLRKAGLSSQADVLYKQFKQFEAPGNELIMTTTDFSHRPEELQAVRRRLAEIILQCREQLK